MSRFKSRLDRLERERDEPDPAAEPRLTQELLVRSILGPPDLTPADQEALLAIWEAAMAIDARAQEASPAARLYREELTRRGLPQPETLDGVDVVDECIRLAGMPSSANQA